VKTIKTLLDTRYLASVVNLAGVQSGDDKFRYYAQASIFCFPTFFESEAFPVVLLKAMQFRLPVDSTRWRGISAIVRDGVTGFLVPINDVAALAERLELLLVDDSLREKQLAQEESIRIPLVVRYPSWFPSGSVSEDFVLNIDLPVTFLDAANLMPPSRMRGISLRKILGGEKTHSSFLVEYFYDPDVPTLPAFRALVSKRFKCITYFDDAGTEELYDVFTDSLELNNLARDPRFSSVIDSLRLQLDGLRWAAGEFKGSVSHPPSQITLFPCYPNLFTRRRGFNSSSLYKYLFG